MRTVDNLLKGVDGVVDELAQFMSAVDEGTINELRDAVEIGVPVATLQLQLAAVLIQREAVEATKRTLALTDQALADEA